MLEEVKMSNPKRGNHLWYTLLEDGPVKGVGGRARREARLKERVEVWCSFGDCVLLSHKFPDTTLPSYCFGNTDAASATGAATSGADTAATDRDFSIFALGARDRDTAVPA